MIALMNYVVPLIIVIGVFIAYKMKNVHAIAITALVAGIYMIAQPTYLPKGTVAAPVIQELEYVDKPIVDRGRKVMSDERRDALRNEKLKQINDSIESKINKDK